MDVRTACATALMLLLTVAADRPSRAAGPPNVVLIYADDLGFGDVSAYGATGVRTPAIDRLAAQGLRFTRVHAAAATCTPSRYALLTGEYAWRRPGTNVLPGDAALVIDHHRPSLASTLRKAGYATGLVGKWHLGLGSGSIDWNGELAEIVRTLERLGLADNTILIVTSDNGPVVDDGYEDQAVERLGAHRPSGPLRGGKYSAFEAGTRVPFVLRWPARVAPGVSEALIGQVDL